jgi:hypothetical protein
MLTVPTVHFLVHRRPLFRTLAASRLHSLLAVVCINSALPPPSLSQEPAVGKAVESPSSALFVAQLYPLEQARLHFKAGVGPRQECG